MIATQNVIAATDGRQVQFQGLITRYIVGSEQTGGAFAIVEHELAPRALGAPLHTHEHEDETSHVTAGRLGVQIGEDTVELGAGDTVFKPRGIAHAFWNPGDEPVRFVEIITPGAFAGYFADVEPILDVPGPPDVAALMTVMARYGLSSDPSSIGRLIAEHGLTTPGV